MPRRAEIRPRHNQQIIFLRLLTERTVIRLQSLREQVKRSLRLDTAVAHLRKAVIKQIAVGLVDRNIACLARTARRYTLEQTGRAHIAQRASRAAYSSIQVGAVRRLRRNQHIADALAGRESDLE